MRLQPTGNFLQQRNEKKIDRSRGVRAGEILRNHLAFQASSCSLSCSDSNVSACNGMHVLITLISFSLFFSHKKRIPQKNTKQKKQELGPGWVESPGGWKEPRHCHSGALIIWKAGAARYRAK